MRPADTYAKVSYRKSIGQALLDLLAFPLRALISDEANDRLGLTSLRQERCAFAARFCEGLVLDVGCGTNKLAAIRRNVIGVDVHPWPEIDVLADTTVMPFAEETFDTVALIAGLNHVTKRAEVLASEDFLAAYASQEDILGLQPDMSALKDVGLRGIIVTAPGDEVDFVSRFFAPGYGIDEDPVTGSAHCALTPYWARRLGKSKLHAYQLSRRGGELFCEDRGDRVMISGRAVLYLQGFITI